MIDSNEKVVEEMKIIEKIFESHILAMLIVSLLVTMILHIANPLPSTLHFISVFFIVLIIEIVFYLLMGE